MNAFDAAAFMEDLLGRDPHRALECCADDVVWEVPGSPRFGGGVHRGQAEMVEFFSLVGRLFPEGLRACDVRPFDGEGSAAVEATLNGVTRGGSPYLNRYVFVIDADDDDRVLRVREYTDTAKAEVILGAEEGPDIA